MLPTPESSQKEDSLDNSGPPSSPFAAPAIEITPAEEDASPVVADSLCPHILELWNDSSGKELFLKRYKSSVIWEATRHAESAAANAPAAKKRKISPAECSKCKLVLVRPALCMHCSYAGCLQRGHIREHLRSNDHTFFTDTKTGSLFCSKCDDFMQSNTLDRLYQSATLSISEKSTHFKDPKKTREAYSQWAPTDKDRELLKSDATSVSCQGRRGLLNLGQTCAMNTVLQSFLHNPLLRNHFLSDKHNSDLCEKKDCMCCEMDNLFSEVYSGELTPHGPLTFLPLIWKAAPSSSLSQGYAQQDAHEVFITCISQIHSTSKGSTMFSCNCVVHSTFSGSLSSELKCGKSACGHVSVKNDPMMDVSLELREKGLSNDPAENTLAACLRRFTLPEKLSPKEYTCERCRSNAGATKSMRIGKLPPVLAFQLKRFGHKTNDKSSASKINTPIRFPSTLNMLPYTTGFGQDRSSGPAVMYLYDLFCVINHDGAMDNGHYINYARCVDEWYRFDDDKVTHATLATVLGSTAYLLFYVKRHLDYKPDARPSYVMAREADILREMKQKEKEKEKELKLSQEIDDELMSIL